jgi:endonuclease G
LGWASFRLAALFVLLPISATAQEVAVTHCLGSCPQYRSTIIANNSKVVIHHLYAAGLNTYNRRADWVAYRLTPQAVGVASLLPRDWQPDRLADFAEISRLADLAELEPEANLPDVSSAVSPYGGVSAPVIDEQNHVRLAPLTSFAKTPYWSELNNLSNMLPMPAPLRRGAWLRLEQALNALVADREELHVVAGPLYFNGSTPGSEALQPGVNLAGYFKIVATGSGTAAFLFPHDLQQSESFCDRLSSVEEIQRLTGLQLFPGETKADSWQLITDLGCTQPVSP